MSQETINNLYAISSLSQIRIVDVVSQMNGALASLAITEGVLRNRFRKWITLFFLEMRKVMRIPQLLVVG
jgi:hypothetical protein